MSQINLGGSGLMVPTIALGAMRMGDKTDAQAQEVVETVLSKGVNFLIQLIFMVMVSQLQSWQVH